MPPRHRHSLRRHPRHPLSSALPLSSSAPPCPRPRRHSMDSKHCQTRAAVAAFVIVADDQTSKSHHQRTPLPSSSWPMIKQASDRTSKSHHQLALPPLPPLPSHHAREREPTSTRAAAVAIVAVSRASESHPRHASNREPMSMCATAAVVVTVTQASKS